MRLADVLLRSGHLSERALVDVCMTGERPAHMDRCDICAERALEVGRWLDEVRALGDADVEAVFPAERLAAQQAQIMRKLEQLDQPARVIAFPKPIRFDDRVNMGRRVAPGWVAAAAAAGLVVGVVGGQFSARFMGTTPVPAPVTASAQNTAVDPAQVADIHQIDEDDLNHVGFKGFSSVGFIDQATPRALTEGQQAPVTLASYPVKGPGDR